MNVRQGQTNRGHNKIVSKNRLFSSKSQREGGNGHVKHNYDIFGARNLD